MINLIDLLYFHFIEVIIGLDINKVIGLAINEVILIEQILVLAFWVIFMIDSNEFPKILDCQYRFLDIFFFKIIFLQNQIIKF